MKFALASDLHLMFGPLQIENTENADVLILAGDIYEADYLFDTTEDHYVMTFFKEISERFPLVLWVAGNHEHYETSYPIAHDYIKNWLKKHGFDNIKFLEKDTLMLGDIAVHGCTLWTNLDKGNPIAMQHASSGMNDYSQIQNWNTYAHFRHHTLSLEWLNVAVKDNKKNLVVTHHHPSMLSTPIYYQNDVLRHAYASDLSEFILDNTNIQVWCCGHIHSSIDYELGSTRVLCNPRGYNGYERRAKDFQLVYFEM